MIQNCCLACLALFRVCTKAHETGDREKAIKYASTTNIHKKSIGKAEAINQSAVCFAQLSSAKDST